MEWQAVVLTLQILLLAIGWVLFQRARGELSARAAETPVFGEVKALHKSITQLLEELETTADREAGRLENACSDARVVLQELEAIMRSPVRLWDYEDEAAEVDVQARVSAIQPESAGRTTNGRRPLSFEEPKITVLVEASASPLNAGEESSSAVHSDAVLSSAPQKVHDLKRRLVFTMADAGESPSAIARAAQLSEGEVETLLGLRSQRQ